MKKWLPLLLTVLLLLLGGCAAEETTPGWDFLETFFAADLDSRWTDFQRSDRSAQAVGEYHAALEPLCSQDCLASIVANRTLYNYDAMVAEAGCNAALYSYRFDQSDEEDVIEFSVRLSFDWPDGTEAWSELDGQLSVNEEGIVTSFWLQDLGDLLQVLEENR